MEKVNSMVTVTSVTTQHNLTALSASLTAVGASACINTFIYLERVCTVFKIHTDPKSSGIEPSS
jgi:hypothetical protein